MKKLAIRLAVIALSGIGATSALADQASMSDPGAAYRISSFAGGAFRATTASGYIGEAGGFGGTNNSFLTFCIERDEVVHLGNATYYAAISMAAQDGGVGGPNPDPISPVTAAMYQEFRNGGAFGNAAALGNNLLDTASEIRGLQRAIWFEEQEIGAGEFNADPVAVAIRNWAIANNNGTIGNVRVLNLWGDANHTQHVQDQLTIVPLPPAALAGMAALSGVFGMGYLRRKGHTA